VASLTACGDRRVLSGGGAGCGKVLLWELDLLYPGECGANAYAATAKPSQARWGAKAVVELGSHRGAVSACCSVTADAACSAGSDGSLRIWRLGSRSLACILQGAPATMEGAGGGQLGGRGYGRTGGVRASEGFLAVRATADGSCVVSGSTGGTLKVWDVETKHVRSEAFLKAEGGESYRRQLTAVRRSLPGLDGR
jgi:WD40 repeat protein